MQQAEELIQKQSIIIIGALRKREKDQVDELTKRFSTDFIVRTATELCLRIIRLRQVDGGRYHSDWLVSSLTTRYLFELTVNFGVMMNTQPEELRVERIKNWREMQNLQILSEGRYGIEVDSLPNSTIKRLEKKGVDFYKGLTQGSDDKEENYADSIMFDHPEFWFEDPWGLKMHEKVKYIDVSDEKSFLNQWQFYSHICHASAFSLWPRWTEPVPHFDAIQCLSIIYKSACKKVNLSFDDQFSNKIFELLRNEG